MLEKTDLRVAHPRVRFCRQCAAEDVEALDQERARREGGDSET